MNLVPGRRAYDRTMVDASSSHSSRHTPGASTSYTSYAYYESRPRRGATHAWEYGRRPGSGPSYQQQRPPPGASAGSGRHYEPPHPDPWSSPHVQRATGMSSGRRTAQQRQAERQHAAEDRVTGESGLIRAIQVVGIVMVIATVGGGLSASAT